MAAETTERGAEARDTRRLLFLPEEMSAARLARIAANRMAAEHAPLDVLADEEPEPTHGGVRGQALAPAGARGRSPRSTDP